MDWVKWLMQWCLNHKKLNLSFFIVQELRVIKTDGEENDSFLRLIYADPYFFFKSFKKGQGGIARHAKIVDSTVVFFICLDYFWVDLLDKSGHPAAFPIPAAPGDTGTKNQDFYIHDFSISKALKLKYFLNLDSKDGII